MGFLYLATIYISGILFGGCGRGAVDKGRALTDSDDSVQIGRQPKVNELSHEKDNEPLERVFNDFGFIFFKRLIKADIPIEFKGQNVPVFFFESENPSLVPVSGNTQLELRKSSNGRCFIIGGYFRRSTSSVYTTAFIYDNEKPKLGVINCGNWGSDLKAIQGSQSRFEDYGRIASAFLNIIRYDIAGKLGGLPTRSGIDIVAIILSESPLQSGH